MPDPNKEVEIIERLESLQSDGEKDEEETISRSLEVEEGFDPRIDRKDK